ncbi:MAG: ribulose-phosphate 3-epimerase [Bacteroidales bacterium]|jgi:ribulose-phosphate 3-epimerase|nr:ribulose-phosphate 3-epimerase [Bacteroidales bacterium]
MRQFISPSILSADFNNLGREIQIINNSQADFIHLDVMDGIFVPNISFGFPVIEHVNKIATKPLDLHLMIIEPVRYVVHLAEAGAYIITVHYEACKDLHRTIRHIKKQGVKASVCLNPNTPVNVLNDIITELDMVLLMSVNPGVGGQVFIESTYAKVRELKIMIDKYNPACLIEVDGGVNYETGRKLFEAGANILASGSFIFKSENPAETISKLKSFCINSCQ